MSAGLTKEWGAFVDWRRVAIVAAAVGLPLAAVPLFTGEFVLHVLTIGAYYAMLAVSWNLLAGFTGQLSLAQHAFAAVGAYVSGLLIYHLQTPLIVSMPLGVLAVTVEADEEAMRALPQEIASVSTRGDDVLAHPHSMPQSQCDDWSMC